MLLTEDEKKCSPPFFSGDGVYGYVVDILDR